VKGGYLIPLAQTTTPLSYQDVFNAIGQLVQAVPPQDLHSLIHELAVGLDGRAGDIRQIIENSASLATTFADNAGAINQSISDLTTLTHTFAQHGGAFGSSLDNLATISASLAQSKQNIDALLTNTPDFLHQVATLLDASGANLGCVIDGLGTVATVLGTPAHVADLSTVLSLSPSLLTHLARMDGSGSDGPYLQGTFNFNLVGAPPIKPAPVQKLPPVPVTPNCPDAGTVGAAPAGGQAPGVGGQAPGGVGSSRVGRTGANHPTGGTATSTARQVGGRHWPIVLLAILGLVLVAVLITRPWRYLTGAAGRRSGRS
jgi:phospholipid/cholesterol/gamma-HCH transport system substrate-binding protein